MALQDLYLFGEQVTGGAGMLLLSNFLRDPPLYEAHEDILFGLLARNEARPLSDWDVVASDIEAVSETLPKNVARQLTFFSDTARGAISHLGAQGVHSGDQLTVFIQTALYGRKDKTPPVSDGGSGISFGASDLAAAKAWLGPGFSADDQVKSVIFATAKAAAWVEAGGTFDSREDILLLADGLSLVNLDVMAFAVDCATGWASPRVPGSLNAVNLAKSESVELADEALQTSCARPRHTI